MIDNIPVLIGVLAVLMGVLTVTVRIREQQNHRKVNHE